GKTNVILIDPGVRDLLYMKELYRAGSHHPDIPHTFPRTLRYTSMQRSSDTNSRRMRRQRETIRAQTLEVLPANFKGPPRTIMHLESTTPSHKTMNVLAFSEWVEWQAVNRASLVNCYNTGIWTTMKFDALRRKMSAEDKLIMHMRERFGPKFLVVMGDWSSQTKGRHRKWVEPSKVAGFRELFKKHHIPCFLLDEYRTSSCCPQCHGRVHTHVLPRRLSPRPWRAALGQMDEVHGLLGCRACEDASWAVNPHTLSRLKYWNRDLLATRNFDLIVRSMIDGNGRPAHLSRSECE
ncbi:hypothetical protein DFJ77DRAFT_473641, partial [Powellomyces hirtus]